MFKEIDYTNSLKKENDYELTRIVATTYSLEPHFVFLLSCLFEYDSNELVYSDLSTAKSLASFDSQENGRKESKNRLQVFYQKDKFNYSVKQFDNKFDSLIRVCCIPVTKESYAFHPKIILAEYVNDLKKHIKHRLIVSSRNLTSSDDLETQVVLECDSSHKLNPFDNIEKLITYINDNSKRWVVRNLDRSCDSVSVHFQHPNSPFSLKEELKLENKDYSKLIFAPFYSLEGKNSKRYSARGAHSKLFCVTKNKKSDLWIGSANCTVNGLSKNYECMVKLGFNDDISEEFEKWLLSQNNISTDILDIMSSEPLAVENIITAYPISCQIENMADAKYQIIFNLETSKDSWECPEDVKVRLLTDNSFVKIENKIIFENIPVEKITNGLIVKANNVYRVVFASCDADTANLLYRNTSTLSKTKLIDIIPDFTFMVKDIGEDSDNNDDEANEIGITSKSITFSPSDEEYEKLLKLYASNRIDLIKIIHSNIKRNVDIFDSKKVEKLLKWTNVLAGNQ